MHFGDRAGVDSDLLRGFFVSVGFARAAAEPSRICDTVKEAGFEADSGEGFRCGSGGLSVY